jgi:hypothetical protein
MALQASVQSIGVEAVLAAMQSFMQEQLEKRRQLENAFVQARFQANRADQQYNAADLENCLVSSNLEQRRKERLLAVRPHLRSRTLYAQGQ